MRDTRTLTQRLADIRRPQARELDELLRIVGDFERNAVAFALAATPDVADINEAIRRFRPTTVLPRPKTPYP